MPKIAESKVTNSRIVLPRAVKFYLHLEPGQLVDWLTTNTDLEDEVLADDCIILRARRPYNFKMKIQEKDMGTKR